jgi:S-adenosylmethionine synthetase
MSHVFLAGSHDYKLKKPVKYDFLEFSFVPNNFEQVLTAFTAYARLNNMTQITIEQLRQVPTARRRTEHVERKGLGHPDTICDRVMEAVSVALSRSYIEACGRVLHHNIDKGLLVAGQSAPRPGGGQILKPMRLIFGDRATDEVNGRPIPVGKIVEETARSWLGQNLRFVDPIAHVVYQNEIQPGSPELVDIFARAELTANDTSAAVGYAPLTETERLVLDAEKYLNSPAIKQRFPEVGEDVKVMAFRCDRSLSLTVAAAFVDRYIPSPRRYFEHKVAVRDDLERHLRARLQTLDHLEVSLNTLDDPARGLGGMYLTVLGTSAEGADGGQVGRGNRVNGLISLHRPMTTEAAAGKNPVSHVGKIYNLLAHQIAGRIYDSVAGIEEVNVWLCSQIGKPLRDPWSIAVELTPAPDAHTAELESEVQAVIAAELATLPNFVERLSRGELPVC